MWRRSVKLCHFSTKKLLQWSHKNFQTGSASGHIKIHPRIQEAVWSGQPVVAFESTIITHGMPYPENLKTAQDVEKIAIDQGVLPATVGVLHGNLCIGMTSSQLEELSASKEAIKIPKRELVWALNQQLSGGTTVSATMFAAHRAGIPVFVTGGIGGVHRGGEVSFDVSSDLTELSRTPVCVVSAGIKSILDIPKTLEYLETEGVTVATYGSSKDFPAFYSPKSGVEANINVNSPATAAKLIDLSFSLGMTSGILIAVPIPEEFTKEGDAIERAIQQGVIESQESGITGKAVTPFILKRVNELTEGKALEANIALIKNNTAVGCAIAKELALLQNKGPTSIGQDSMKSRPVNKDISKRTFSTLSSSSFLKSKSKLNILQKRKYCHSNSTVEAHRSRPVVIGASIVDFVASLKSSEILYRGATNNGSLRLGFGGVGRNIADCMSRLGLKPLFISAVGRDAHAQSLLHHCRHMCIDGVIHLDQSTATYCVITDIQGEILVAIGDMNINDKLAIEHVMQYESAISKAPLVVLDGNPSVDIIHQVCQLCAKHQIPVWFEPTCVKKATKPFSSDGWRTLSYSSPNLNELRMMYAALEGKETVSFDRDLSLTDKLRECLQLSRRLLQHMYCLVITLDEDGVLVVRNSEPDDPFLVGGTYSGNDVGMMSAVHYPTFTDDQAPQNIISVSGAGDCLAAAMITSIIQGQVPDTCIKMGLYAANLSLQSHQSVPDSIRAEDFTEGSIQRWASFEPSRMM